MDSPIDLQLLTVTVRKTDFVHRGDGTLGLVLQTEEIGAVSFQLTPELNEEIRERTRTARKFFRWRNWR